MLKKLHIQNYAIIDEIDIQFSESLNIITGETGAGKSILIGALSLILGERADSSVLLKNDKKCFIEGSFLVTEKEAVKAFLSTHDLDIEEELTIRREIAANGKSRAFINDTPATLAQLKELASCLVDLHQQFDTLEIGDTLFQREVIDALAGNQPLLQTYVDAYKQWMAASKDLQLLELQKSSFNKELDYFQFQYDELEETGLKANELEELDTELQLLSNSEGIKTALVKTYFDITGSELPITSSVKQLANQLNGYSAFHTSLPLLVERLQSVHIELQDIANEAEQISETIGFDEKRVDEINARLSIGYKLLKKHGVLTTGELLKIKDGLEKKLQAVLDIDGAIAAKEKEAAALFKQANAAAAGLATKRKKQASPLEKDVNTLLAQIGMPNARLKVDIKEVPLNQFGSNEIEFLFDANKSNRFEPIRKVASGGELSRLMLCIKSLVAKSIDLPTMIFDEIDTGISGEAAKQVGIIMKSLAANRQIICITHQPQIAGKANAHYFVYKENKGNTIKTNIRLLTDQERINAIAQMLSGEKPTAAALENAREMVRG
ncbi:DNA repair protein RecN [Parasediminibacterium sp. JCM 36343]|uniref:DNA repair protein RecN n=1 Tax=Parasediminibacterium sp. JCM 36343 TaxID=3374279 RepID=UPI00397A435E